MLALLFKWVTIESKREVGSEGETEDWVREGPGGYSGLDWPLMDQKGILDWTGRSWVRGVFWIELAAHG